MRHWLTPFIKLLLARLAVVVLLCRCTESHKAVTHFAFQVQLSLPSESSLSLVVIKDADARAHACTPLPTQPSVFVLTPVFAHCRKVRFTHTRAGLGGSARCLCAAFTGASCLPCPLIKAICSPGPSPEKSALFCSSDTVVLAFEKICFTFQLTSLLCLPFFFIKLFSGYAVCQYAVLCYHNSLDFRLSPPLALILFGLNQHFCL